MIGGNVNRPSEPGLGANECVPSGKWCESTAFRSLQTATISACSSKRTVRLINGIALDQCRVRERYPARRPFYIFHLRARVARKVPLCGTKPVIETGRRCLLV